MTNLVLLTLTTLPALQAPLVDWLLARADVPDFTTVAIHRHGSTQRELSAAEQVEGHQRQIMFAVVLSGTVVENLVEELRREFAGSPIHYWVTPVLTGGHLNNEGSAV